MNVLFVFVRSQRTRFPNPCPVITFFTTGASQIGARNKTFAHYAELKFIEIQRTGWLKIVTK